MSSSKATRPRGSSLRHLRRAALGAAAAILLLYPANSVFYAGWGGVEWSWRLEHGRMKIECSPRTVRESLYLAGNSEPRRYALEWRRRGPGDWEAQVPLWLPALLLLSTAAACGIAERRERRSRAT